MIKVTNTATAGATPALSTTTYGPYAVSLYNGTQTGTQTTTAGFTNYYPLNGTGGITANAGSGGISLQQGDTLHVQRGTDASAVTAFAIEYGVTPLSNLTK